MAEMAFLIVLGLFLANETSFNVEDIGLYQPERATVWQWGEDFLFCEYIPPRLVMVSSGGEVKSHFDKEGQGPEELFRPTIMGFDDQFVYVLKSKSHIMVFDKNLNLVNRSLPSLQPVVGSKIVWEGVKIGDNRFVLIYGCTGSQHSHGMIQVELRGKKWHLTESFFPFDILKENINLPLPIAKNPKWQVSGTNLFRLTATVLKEEDSYEILQYLKPWESEKHDVPIGGLFANVEGIISKNKNFRCFPERVGVLPDGFVVEISFDRTEIIHDYFDKEGGFLHRDFESYHIIPVGNANKTLKLEWENEREILTLIQ